MQRLVLSTAIASAIILMAGCDSSNNNPVASSDEIVLLSSSGGGKTTNPKTIWKFPISADGLGLRSDELYTTLDGFSKYEDGVCGVTSQIFLDGTNDGTMQTNNPRNKPRDCKPYSLSVYPRKITVVYPVEEGRQPETMEAFFNARNIGTIAEKTRELRIFSLNPTQTERCDAWRWSDETHNNVTHTGDKVWVERLQDIGGKRQYRVYTQDRGPTPIPNANRATCTTTLENHHLSVDFYIVEK